MSSSLPKLIPLEEFAEANRISLRWLLDCARRKEFQHTRIGSRRYFTEDQLADYLRAMAVATEKRDDLAGVRSRVGSRLNNRNNSRGRSE